MSVLDPNPGIGIHSKHVARVRLRYSLFPAYLYVCQRISLSFSRDYSDSRLIVSVESESSLVRLVDEFQPPLGLPRLASVVQREPASVRPVSICPVGWPCRHQSIIGLLLSGVAQCRTYIGSVHCASPHEDNAIPQALLRALANASLYLMPEPRARSMSAYGTKRTLRRMPRKRAGSSRPSQTL